MCRHEPSICCLITAMTSPIYTSLSALFAPLSVLKGVGPKMLPLLAKLLRPSDGKPPRVVDLLFHMPTGVIDRGTLMQVDKTRAGEMATLQVTIGAHRFPKGRHNRAPYRVVCFDDSGEITLVYFAADVARLKSQFPIGEQRLVSGTVEEFADAKQIVHPDYVLPLAQASRLPVVEPVYGLTEGLYLKNLHRLFEAALPRLEDTSEWSHPALLVKKDWPGFAKALHKTHRPKTVEDAQPQGPAWSRLAYDEFLAGQLALQLHSGRQVRQNGIAISGSGDKVKAILAALPFKLTNAQARVIGEIEADMRSKKAMLRLLQGDVGSGKTIVALLAMAQAAEAGLQSVLMAPTEILARQHLATLAPLAEKAGMRLALLTGREKGEARAKLLAALSSGEINGLIGTHAVFQDGVVFHNLALAIVDEQHRFGVNQRLALSNKGNAVNLLVMTATPIPRTLVLTYFGDMDVSKLDEKPAGRPRIDTRAMPLSRLSELVEALRAKLDSGDRVYWICPLISESEKSDMTAVEQRHEMLHALFGDTVALLHGRMKAADKDSAMAAFASGAAQILVATTVVEVGVNVPEATIIVIEQAERFGLAQLHQLRGRVGRSDLPSTCLLLYGDSASLVAKERLKVMRETEDGFVIAEADLRLRGQGDVLGTKQSGLPPTRMVDWAVHAPLAQIARDDAKAILAQDPDLLTPRGLALRTLLRIFDKTDMVELLKAG